jgi:hypothetical protein
LNLAKPAGLFGKATVAAVLGALALFTADAAAAPPIVCVRNATAVDLDVVAGIQGDSTGKPGVYLGKAKARGGACRYADIDGTMNVSFRRVAGQESLGEQYREISTAGGGWVACPAQASADGWYIYTVRRGLFGLTCKAGGDPKGLEDPGEYE